MKKGILAAVLLCCTAFVLLFALVPVSADETATHLYGSTITDAEVGKEYTVNIGYTDLDLAPIKGITLDLSWDKNALELVSVNSTLAGSGFFFVPTPVDMSNDAGFSKCAFASSANLLRGDTGSLVSLTFRVKEGASGSLPIAVEPEAFGSDKDHDYSDALRVTDACITLKGETPAVTTDAGTPEISTPPVTAGSSPEIIPPIEPVRPVDPIPQAPSASVPSSPAKPEDEVTAHLAERFPIVSDYDDGAFDDLDKKAWYFTDQYIQLVCSLGLMEGRGDGKFAPDANLKLTEAITLAVRIRDIYEGGTGYLSVSGKAWYEPYVEYAIENGIVKEGRFADLEQEATRADMAELFAAALPKECYAKINSLSSLPDVSKSHRSFDAILALYNAGIVQGDSAVSRTFRPDDSIRRSEVAAILIRMVIPDRRIEF